jgi:hypothetical protein
MSGRSVREDEIMADLESHFQITMDESNITEEVLVREPGADARARAAGAGVTAERTELSVARPASAPPPVLSRPREGVMSRLLRERRSARLHADAPASLVDEERFRTARRLLRSFAQTPRQGSSADLGGPTPSPAGSSHSRVERPLIAPASSASARTNSPAGMMSNESVFFCEFWHPLSGGPTLRQAKSSRLLESQ